MRRTLKSNGTLYLHCDSTASHYLKVLLDGVFGPACFRNEVIWRYRRWPARARRFLTIGTRASEELAVDPRMWPGHLHPDKK